MSSVTACAVGQAYGASPCASSAAEMAVRPMNALRMSPGSVKMRASRHGGRVLGLLPAGCQGALTTFHGGQRHRKLPPDPPNSPRSAPPPPLMHSPHARWKLLRIPHRGRPLLCNVMPDHQSVTFIHTPCLNGAPRRNRSDPGFEQGLTEHHTSRRHLDSRTQDLVPRCGGLASQAPHSPPQSSTTAASSQSARRRRVSQRAARSGSL